MSDTIVLKGLAWNHSRAYPPLVASAQRFEELNPQVRIEWGKQSLHDFGHADVVVLAREFDLVVIDHPWAGVAVPAGLFFPLNEVLPAGVVEDLAVNSIGSSFASYEFDDELFALPIDAASQCASYREDLLAIHGYPPPKTWSEVLTLARQGLVAIPGFHVDVLLTFLGMCVSRGGVSAEREVFIDPNVGVECLETLREFAVLLSADVWECQPIRLYEEMARRADWAYCPFAFTYNNYARPGFADHVLRFANLVTMPNGDRLRGVLGGTGIAVSTRCRNPEIAFDYASRLAGVEWQQGFYFGSGGQPARREVWMSGSANALTNFFFEGTRESTEEAWLRPRHNGYIAFQGEAGLGLVEYLREGGDPVRLIERTNELYVDCKRSAPLEPR